jgi:SAM-dependent methyltransferase
VLLDVGTGPGPVAAAAVGRGLTVTAVDAEPSMAEAAARNVPQAEVRVGTLPDLGLQDRAFDAIVGNFVIQHVGDPYESLRSLHSLLRPGGRIALTCWHVPHSTGNTLIRSAMTQAGVDWPADVPPSPFADLAEPAPFADLMTETGFTNVKVTEHSWLHHVDPDLWWSGPASGVGPNGLVLTRLDAPTITKIKTIYDTLAAEYATPDGTVALPACALLATASR